MEQQQQFAWLAAILWSSAGVMFLTFLQGLIPPDMFHIFEDLKRQIRARFSFFYTFIIREECNGASRNDLYKAVHHFARSRCLDTDAESMFVELPRRPTAKGITFQLAQNNFIKHDFRGHRMKWEFIVNEDRNQLYGHREYRSYQLVVPRAAKDVVRDYLDTIVADWKKWNRCKARERHLYTNTENSEWSSMPFDPPSTLDTVAMDPATKELLKKDLTKFLGGKEYYASVGRAWKRGYLLHGPPGTGKSSLVGAISNFTGYDVFDLELTRVGSNADLKQLLIQMNDRAIVVVEDIDCSVQLCDRADENNAVEKTEDSSCVSKSKGITLSGLLNFTDGLWSSTGSERIFIFTTNYVEKLDPALLRPGRMDLHIEMGYCSFPVFQILARNYLRVEDHELFPEIAALLPAVDITPAAVVEELLRNDENPTACFESLLQRMRSMRQSSSSSSSTSVVNDLDSRSPSLSSLDDETDQSLL